MDSELFPDRIEELLAKAEFLQLPPILEALDEEDILAQIPPPEPKDIFWDEVEVGDTAAIRIHVTWKWILLFAMVSGDYNPIHVSKEFAATVGKKVFGGKNIAHGALSNSFLSGVSGYRLLGSGIYLHRKLEANYLKAVEVGDDIIAVADVEEKYSEMIKGKERYFLKIANRIYIVRDDGFDLAVSSPSIAGVLRKSRDE
ncbi:MAG TPA: MaoC/PaaZ C-terminal domain-containing protein [Candidatus Lokiarchaeia archaeon]|nr:MaoC/PaaZ C-terminal domain-containing protein [Candidatus Lokiarchaeia archaeon]